MMNFSKVLLMNFLILMLTGCGFHLRGYEPLPVELKTLYLQTSSPYSDFSKGLKLFLTSNKIILVDKPQEAPITLQILSEGTSQQLTSTGSNGQINTYTLNYNVVYQLLSKQGEILQSPQTVSSTRNYSVTSNQVLGDTNVQNTLVNQMRREVIYLMINRMRNPKTLRNMTATLAKTV